MVELCLADIRAVLRKKPLSFKVNAEIKEVVENTKISLEGLRKHLRTVKETKCIGCCGTE